MDLSYLAMAFILSQLLFVVYVWGNCRFVLSKYKRDRSWYRPRAVICVPCKNLDSAFEKNISSFYRQNYENYQLCFVVGEKTDPAYEALCRLKDKLAAESKADDVRILIAGHAELCGQKVHNLLCCYKNVSDDVEVMAFADSDICVRSDWLSHLVYPLRQDKTGVASGYRWFVPDSNNPASLAMSILNGKIAQLLGNTRFNHAWGGSMAIRVEVFRELEVEKIWSRAISDDLSLSYAVKEAGLKVAFVPGCLVASHESTRWGKLFEFGRRQFMITRVCAAKTWWAGLLIGLYSVVGLWGTGALAVYSMNTGGAHLGWFVAVPIFFLFSQFMQAVLRQKMIRGPLKENRHQMKIVAVVDILFFWVWSPLLLVFILSSAFGRVICWRGIRYKMLGPTETIILK